MMSTTLLFIPSDNDVSQKSLVAIFSLLPRISIASLMSYFVSQLIDVYIYNKLKEKNAQLWVKNNISTIISQLIDSILFVNIAFLGIFKMNEIISLILTMCIFKIVLALIDTPFMYIASLSKCKDELDKIGDNL